MARVSSQVYNTLEFESVNAGAELASERGDAVDFMALWKFRCQTVAHLLSGCPSG